MNTRDKMDHAQAELMELLWKKEQAAKKAGKRWTASDNKKAAEAFWKNKEIAKAKKKTK